MNIVDILQLIITLVSTLAAVLAWIAKIRWSQEYTMAKDETIKSRESQLLVKDEQILAIRALLENKDEIIKSKNAEIDVLARELENLRQFTPMKIKEYFLSVKSQLEEYNDNLKQELEKAMAKLKEKDQDIQNILASQTKVSQDSIKIETESRQELQAQVVLLESQAKQNDVALQELEKTTEQDFSKPDVLSKISSLGVGGITTLIAAEAFLPGVGFLLAPALLGYLSKSTNKEKDKGG